jgi:hypothetical protein
MSEKREKVQPSFCIEDSIHLPRRKIIEYPKQEAALCGALYADYADQPHALILFVRMRKLLRSVNSLLSILPAYHVFYPHSQPPIN